MKCVITKCFCTRCRLQLSRLSLGINYRHHRPRFFFFFIFYCIFLFCSESNTVSVTEVSSSGDIKICWLRTSAAFLPAARCRWVSLPAHIHFRMSTTSPAAPKRRFKAPTRRRRRSSSHNRRCQPMKAAFSPLQVGGEPRRLPRSSFPPLPACQLRQPGLRARPPWQRGGRKKHGSSTAPLGAQIPAHPTTGDDERHEARRHGGLLTKQGTGSKQIRSQFSQFSR